MTRIAWLQAALEDLRGIHAYIARDNPAAARRVVGTIRDDVKILRDHPAIGRPGRIERTRELAVVHSSRRWPEQLP